MNTESKAAAKEAFKEVYAKLDQQDRALTVRMHEAVQKCAIPVPPLGGDKIADLQSQPVNSDVQAAGAEGINDKKINPEPATTIADQPSPSKDNPRQTRDKFDKLRDSAAPAGSPSDYGPATGPLGYLNTLPPETQEYVRKVVDEYSLRRGAEILSGPAPDGLGRPMTHHALFRFVHRERRAQERSRIAQIAEEALSHLDDPTASEHDYTSAANRVLRARLLETIAQVESLNLIESVHKMLNQLRRTDIAERRLAHSEIGKQPRSV